MKTITPDPKRPRTVLDRDQYDALEFTALVHEGVGDAVTTFNGKPCCLWGLARFAGITDRDLYRVDKEYERQVMGCTYIEVDDAVEYLRQRGLDKLDADGCFRVPFGLLMKRLNIVRGQ